MPFLNDRVYDNGLSSLDLEVDQLHLCSDEPTTYAEAIALSLASKNGVSIGAPQSRIPSGRRVLLAAVTAESPGTVHTSGTVTHYALVDSANERLLAANALTTVRTVIAGNTFTTGVLEIGIPGPV